ncbi:MAG TPA: sigma-70 family RNA polymerase sigma factor, partial [Acidimicrobiales bacterium]|nr:sigma-70 family RNA polymerase sigma factor [Acidimicrobiales bacterium]
ARLVARQLPAPDEAEAVTGAVDAADQWQRVAVAISLLPSAERDVLSLHVWEELSYEDIAAAVGIPVGTVRSRLNRARRRLRELTDRGGEVAGEGTTP